MSDPWDTDYRRIFIATYGAVFAGMVLQHMRDGRGTPGPHDYDLIDEKAATIAVAAAERRAQ